MKVRVKEGEATSSYHPIAVTSGEACHESQTQTVSEEEEEEEKMRAE
jgi:hypothetical protein